MSYPHSLPVAAALVLLVVESEPRGGERPQLVPTRDVSIIYEVSRPDRPRVRERVRWMASKGLDRIDGPNHSTIFDRKANAVVLLNSTSHTYSAGAGAPRWAIEPEPGGYSNEELSPPLRGSVALIGPGPTTWRRTPFA